MAGSGMEIPMSLIIVETGETDGLHASDGWGDVPVEDRGLWSQYMLDHLPWFPGTFIMTQIYQGVTNGNTRAPQIWKDTARGLHAVGFTPADYYLLAEMLKHRLDWLEVTHHAVLFEAWPTSGERGPRTFRLNPARWTSWLEVVRAGGSPARELNRILRDAARA